MATAPTNDIAIIATENSNDNDYSTKLTPRDEIFTYGFQVQFLAYEELNYLFNNHGNWLDYVSTSITEILAVNDDLQDQITSNDDDITALQTRASALETQQSTDVDDISDLQDYVGYGTSDNESSDFIAKLFDGFFPVGTVYNNDTNSANPSTYLLGASSSTWVAIAGRVIVGAGTGTDDNSYEQTFTAQDTGGEYVHTQTEDELVAHVHEIDMETDSDGEHHHFMDLGGNGENETVEIPSMSDTGADDSWVYETGSDYGDTHEGAHKHGISGNTESTGGGLAMNNIQPYYVAYTWRRTA